MPSDPRQTPAELAGSAADGDIHPGADTSRGDLELLRTPRNLLLTVPEAASILRVACRTVWRLMADPSSGFPKRRRIRGRTLLMRDEVLTFVAKEASR